MAIENLRFEIHFRFSRIRCEHTEFLLPYADCLPKTKL